MTTTTHLVEITDTPRFSAEIREQLSDLRKVIEVARRHGTRDFASQVGWESLILHEQELMDELAESELYEQTQKSGAESHQHETLRLLGTLVGGSLEAGHFELRVGDDLYTGDVAELAKAGMRKLRFGADVEAEVEIAVAASVPSRSESQPCYVLRSVNPVVGS